MRVGVVWLVPPPADAAVDALRRGMDDGALGRIAAHLTFVPPVNVRADRLAEALDLLRVVGADSAPFEVTLGPPTTFWPDTPVAYLPVIEGAERVMALRNRVFAGPLERPLSWPYVPHVTIAEEASPERIQAAAVALSGLEIATRSDRIHLLAQHEDKIWRPLAEIPLGPPQSTAQGSLPLRLEVTTVADPLAFGPTGPPPEMRFITARRPSSVAGWVSLALAPGEAALGTARHLAMALWEQVELTETPAFTPVSPPGSPQGETSE
ncbi:MAG: 2'-5' RNA ligase family protein [Acidimicrobiales bacterium]